MLPAVKAQARSAILASTRVYACTIDSTPRMVAELYAVGVSPSCRLPRIGGRPATSGRGQRSRQLLLALTPRSPSTPRTHTPTPTPPALAPACPPACLRDLPAFPQVTLHLDSVLIDEAGCVSEMALPTLICLAPSNLVLIGDPLQVREGPPRPPLCAEGAGGLLAMP